MNSVYQKTTPVVAEKRESEGCTRLPLEVLRRSDIGAAAKLCYVIILCYEGAFFSEPDLVAYLGETANLCPSLARRAVDELDQAGLLGGRDG